MALRQTHIQALKLELLHQVVKAKGLLLILEVVKPDLRVQPQDRKVADKAKPDLHRQGRSLQLLVNVLLQPELNLLRLRDPLKVEQRQEVLLELSLQAQRQTALLLVLLRLDSHHLPQADLLRRQKVLLVHAQHLRPLLEPLLEVQELPQKPEGIINLKLNRYKRVARRLSLFFNRR